MEVLEQDVKSSSAIKLDFLNWYWDLVDLSTQALGVQDFEAYDFYENWRRDIKGGVLV